VALEVALLRPALVRSLMLLSPAGLGAGISRSFLSQFPKLSSSDDVLTLLRTLVVDPRLINSMVPPVVLKQMEKSGVREYLERMAKHLTRVETTMIPAVSAVITRDIPRLIVWGNEDVINPLDKAQLLKFGGQQHRLDNCGHLPHMEKRSAVNALLGEFLSAQPLP